MIKLYTLKKQTCSRGEYKVSTHTGTLIDLIEAFSYTLECGASYSWEKGNKKINSHPTTFKGLISNLNKAVENSSANGCSNATFS